MLDAEGKPELLAPAAARPTDARRSTSSAPPSSCPATFFVFDLLAFEDFDLRPLPLVERKAAPARASSRSSAPCACSTTSRARARRSSTQVAQARPRGHHREEGRRAVPRRALRQLAQDQGGADGRLRHRRLHRAEGHAQRTRRAAARRLRRTARSSTPAASARASTTRCSRELDAMLAPIVRDDAAVHGPVVARRRAAPSATIPETKTTTWVEPRVRRARCGSASGRPTALLRHPAFLRLRDDKHPRDCERRGLARRDGAAAPSAERRETDAPRAPPPTEPVAPQARREDRHLLQPRRRSTGPPRSTPRATSSSTTAPSRRGCCRICANRPVVMTRFPDGIDGKSFYQKDAPEFAPDVGAHGPHLERGHPARDPLLRLRRRGVAASTSPTSASIPLHIWASRVGSLEQPDWCVIDLDPKEAPFSDVIRTRAGRSIAALRDDRAAELREDDRQDRACTSCSRSAGSAPTSSRARSASCSRACVLRELGDIATITRHVTKRGDKVYLDYLQNRHGQTIVAPFSVRPLPGATVSMPLAVGRGRSTASTRGRTRSGTRSSGWSGLASDPVVPGARGEARPAGGASAAGARADADGLTAPGETRRDVLSSHEP